MYSVAYLVLSLVCVRCFPSPHRSIHFRLDHVTRTLWSRGSNEALGPGNSVANITTVKSNRSVIKVKEMVTNDNLYPSLNKFVLFSGGWKAFWKSMQNRGAFRSLGSLVKKASNNTVSVQVIANCISFPDSIRCGSDSWLGYDPWSSSDKTVLRARKDRFGLKPKARGITLWF